MTETQRLLLDQLLPGRHAVVVALPDFTGLSTTNTTREQARIALGLPPHAKIALFFGLVRPYKRLGDLIEAVGILHSRGQEVFLVVAGEFWEYEGRYVRQVERLGLEEFVRLLNRYVPNEEIAPMFKAADVLVVPHLPGIQSGVAGLARSFGLPVVTTREEDMAGDSAAGVFLAEGRDPESLAGVIESALSAPPKLSPLAQAKGHEWDEMARVIDTLAHEQKDGTP